MNDRLYRSRSDRMLAGVAGGLAEMWDADPALIRVVWALLVVFTGGVALVVYIVMAIVVPEDDGAFAAGAGSSSSFVAGAPSGTSSAGPASTGTGWVVPGTDPRVARREARAASRAARGDRAGFPAAVVLGGFLILLGGFFLAREFIPQLDFDLVWPLFLIGLGVVLLVTALRRPPNVPGRSDDSAGSVPGG